MIIGEKVIYVFVQKCIHSVLFFITLVKDSPISSTFSRRTLVFNFYLSAILYNSTHISFVSAADEDIT